MLTSSRIVLVGTGYWSNVIRKLLPKDISWYSTQSSGSSLFSLAELGKHLERASGPLLVFLPIGPIHHFSVLDVILKNSNSRHKIWIEKPLFCRYDCYENQIAARVFAEHDMFVDYPYLQHNLAPSAQYIRSIVASKIDLLLFSKNFYRRSHSELIDFLPHLFSILSLFFAENVLKSINFSGFNSCSVGPHIHKVSFFIGNTRIRFCFGQSDRQSCLRLVSNGISHTYELQELFQCPVTANVNMFINQPCEVWPAPARSLSFSEFIRDQSVKIESKE